MSCPAPWGMSRSARERLWRRRVARVMGLVVLGLALNLHDSVAPHVAPQEAVPAVTMVQPAGPEARSPRVIPERPFPGQKKKNCEADSDGTTINGGCWRELKKQPPCGKDFEHKGACWIPVAENPATPVALPPAAQ